MLNYETFIFRPFLVKELRIIICPAITNYVNVTININQYFIFYAGIFFENSNVNTTLLYDMLTSK